jgi:uncharacterized membrane protein YphA (DoxX/SURF4 family)
MEAIQESRVNSSYWALRTTYVLVPLLAGLDKFANLLTYWPKYLSPAFERMLPLSSVAFMRIVGVVEVVAALLVLLKPRIGAYVVMAWLICIAINLASMGSFDIAVRDLAMAVGAFVLARLQEARAGVPSHVRIHREAAANV